MMIKKFMKMETVLLYGQKITLQLISPLLFGYLNYKPHSETKIRNCVGVNINI